jgi:RHS repeat-associated protein
VIRLRSAILIPAVLLGFWTTVKPSQSAPAVTVTLLDPDWIGRPPSAGTFYVNFEAQSPDTLVRAATFTCSAVGSVSCVNVSPASYIFDWESQTTQVQVAYNTGAVGTGTITLTATHGAFVRTADFNVNVVTPTAPTSVIEVAAEIAGTRTVVHRRQPVIRAVINPSTFAIDSGATRLYWRGEDVTSLARFNTRMIEWEVDSLHRLGIGDSALIAVQACDVYSTCSTNTRWAVLLNDGNPVLGFSGTPLGVPSGRFSAPFGPGISVTGLEVETGFSTIPYYSMEQARSTGLVYSTRQAYPRVLVPVDLELPWPTVTPGSIEVRLKDNDLEMDNLIVNNGPCLSGAVRTCRVVLKADYSATTFPTPVRKWLRVEVRVLRGTNPDTLAISVDSTEVAIVDRRTTPFGAGWWPSAGTQLVDLGDDRMLVAANGDATIFRGMRDSTYLSPPGSTDVLRRNGAGWELAPRGSPAKVTFDWSGRLSLIVDQNGNQGSVYYTAVGGSDTVVSQVNDPTGSYISFGYTSGKLSTITSPGSRTTKVVIDGSNRLTSDTLLSGGNRPYPTAYGYSGYTGGSQLLTVRVGPLNDTTIVNYDPTYLRPNQAILPRVQNEFNALVQPSLLYLAYERQGMGALRSMDSLYVQITDPRSNWTRSSLNRYGQPVRTWDSYGLIGKSAFSPEGMLIWSEGKNGDSSRTYQEYDSRRRLKRTYIVRGIGDTLTTASFAYGATGPFIVDSTSDVRGKWTRFGYDYRQNLISVRDPSNNYASSDYDPTTGQVVWAREKGDTGRTTYTYHATGRQVQKIKDMTGTTLDSILYDGFGRDTLHVNRIRVQLDTAYRYQWRRTRKYYALDNLVDSVQVQRGDNCNLPCASPPNWTTLTDTLHLETTARRYDRAGRDTLYITSKGLASRTAYDVLGRVRVRWPWTDSLGVTDSFYYDVTGNALKHKTRRGYLIETQYDSRNRISQTVIPTVGTIATSYSGPQDELTRLYYVSRVDSIGNTPGDLRWVYDQRGRLKADTSFYGSSTNATFYKYDAYERLTQDSNTVGAWKVRYETTRGYADTLITPFGETIVYTHDVKGRAIGPTILTSGVVRFARTQVWTSPGQLDSIKNLVGVVSGGGSSQWNAGTYARTGGDGPNMPVVTPTWTEERGLGGTSYSWRDSVGYDAWGRVKSWVTKRGSTVMVRDTMKFDRNGNAKTNGGGESYNTFDRILSRTVDTCTYSYSYDRDGNQSQAVCGPTTYVYGYDALNRLVSVRRNGVLQARYAYDAIGRRIAKRVYSTASGGVIQYRRFVYRGDHVSFETDSTGVIGQQNIWGLDVDDLVGIRVGSTSYYVVQDQIRSIRGLTTASGTWKLSMSYGPYGEVADSASSGLTGIELRYRWTGREYDQETKLYYFRSRYYSSGERRFIQEDRIGYGGGRNLYTYVNGMVQNARDPSGKHTPTPWQMEPTYGGKCMDPGGDIYQCGGSRSMSLQVWGAGMAAAYDAWALYKQNYTKFVQQMQGDTNTKIMKLISGSKPQSLRDFTIVYRALSANLSKASDAFYQALSYLMSGQVFVNPADPTLGTTVTDRYNDGSVRVAVTTFNLDAIGRSDIGLILSSFVHEWFHSTGVAMGEYDDAYRECAASLASYSITGYKDAAWGRYC